MEWNGINCHIQHENWVTILDFWLSQGSVATHCRWGGNLCDMYTENFHENRLVKKFWKSVHICQSYCQTSSGLLFSGTQCYIANTGHMKQLWSDPHPKYARHNVGLGLAEALVIIIIITIILVMAEGQRERKSKTRPTLSMCTGSYLIMPCLFNTSYASFTFGSWDRTWLHPYNNSVHLRRTLSDTWLPVYCHNKHI